MESIHTHSALKPPSLPPFLLPLLSNTYALSIII